MTFEDWMNKAKAYAHTKCMPEASDADLSATFVFDSASWGDAYEQGLTPEDAVNEEYSCIVESLG